MRQMIKVFSIVARVFFPGAMESFFWVPPYPARGLARIFFWWTFFSSLPFVKESESVREREGERTSMWVREREIKEKEREAYRISNFLSLFLWWHERTTKEEKFAACVFLSHSSWSLVLGLIRFFHRFSTYTFLGCSALTVAHTIFCCSVPGFKGRFNVCTLH